MPPVAKLSTVLIQKSHLYVYFAYLYGLTVVSVVRCDVAKLLFVGTERRCRASLWSAIKNSPLRCIVLFMSLNFSDAVYNFE